MITTEYLSRKTRVSDQYAEALDSLKVASEDVVLDIGCGAGRASTHLYPTGARIFGLDLDTSIYNVPKARKITGDANADKTWDEIPHRHLTVMVSCDAINKRGVKLETLARRIRPGTRFAFKVQLADDLGGIVGSSQLYSVAEIQKLLPGCHVTPLRFEQKFSSSDYLNTFLNRVGLHGAVPVFDRTRVFTRSYAIVTGGLDG